MEPLLTRYWFVLATGLCGEMTPNTLGVTAYSREDAVALIQSELLKGLSLDELPEIIDVIEDIDIRTLDPGHIRPNMGICTRRGVWWPNRNSY